MSEPTETPSIRLGQGGRPTGEIRAALLQAAHRLHEQGQPFTWRELACAAQVGFHAARITTDNMVRAGNLRAVGTRKIPGCRRPVNVYVVPAQQAAMRSDSAAALRDAVIAWFR